MTESEVSGIAAAPNTRDKRLVLVVHGVGDEAPGCAVKSLTRSILSTRQKPGTDAPPTREVLWLSKTDDKRWLKEFPCHIERVPGEGYETVLAEVWWADLSRPPSSLLGTIQGVFEFIFGLRYLARYAACPKKGQSQWCYWSANTLKWLCETVAYMLRGPVLAATATWLIWWGLLVGALKLDLSVGLLNHLSSVGTVCGVTAGAVSILIAAWGRRYSHGRSWDAFFLWIGITGVTAVGFFSVWHVEGSLDDFNFKNLFNFLEAGRISPSFIVTIVLVATWLAWLLASLFAKPAERPGLNLALVASTLMTLLLTLVVNLVVVWAWSLQWESMDRTQREGFLDEYVLPRMSIYWIVIFGLGLVLVAAWVRRQSWMSRTTAQSYDPSQPAPRLILSEWAVEFIVFAALNLPIATLLPLAIFRYLAVGNTLFTVASILIATAAVSHLAGPLRQGLDLGLDVMRRFERPAFEVSREPLAWERIQDRFKNVLRRVLELEKPTRLTIVAHSQGTIVAIDALSGDDAKDLLTPLPVCDLVTLGSPFGHLYQYYFTTDYPPLDEKDRWDGLKKTVERWVNIFRVDDFVGAHIVPCTNWTEGERLGPDVRAWPENRAVNAAGHTGYWADLEVVKILCDEKLV